MVSKGGKMLKRGTLWVMGLGLVLICGTAHAYVATLLERETPSLFERFGASLDVSGDWAIIGNGEETILFFQNDGAAWTQQQVIEQDLGANFGDDVAIDGDYAIVGAHSYEVTGVGPAGAAYIYHFDGSTWVEQTILTADDAGLNDLFGKDVDISGDIAVVASRSDDVEGVDDCGSVYVFQRNGDAWSQMDHLIASDYSDGADFGWSVAISGETILVGAQEADPAGTSSGAAYIYTYDGSQWVEQILSASDGAGQDYFGFSVDIDGDRVLIGAHGNDESDNNAGAAYVFEDDGGTWVEQQKLLGPSGSILGTGFGKHVTISGDWALVETESYPDNNGSVVVYHSDGSTWSELYSLESWTGGLNHDFGGALAIEGDVAYIGDSGEGMHASFAGCVWIVTELDNPMEAPEQTPQERPTNFELLPVYPNPFNPSATVRVKLASPAELRIRAYNTEGQVVATLGDGLYRAGVHHFIFDGAGLSSGLYFIHATIPGELNQVQKVILMR